MTQSNSATPGSAGWRRRVVLLCIIMCANAVPLGAQSVRDFIPADAANCAVTSPPTSAGIAATPGGFLMVHPRNDAIGNGYTGCKVLWVVDTDRMPRLATLYFEAGVLSRALSHDVRSTTETIEVACDLRAGRSLLPNGGRKATDAMCRGLPDEALYGLRVATWPRMCLREPDAVPCTQDPR